MKNRYTTANPSFFFFFFIKVRFKGYTFHGHVFLMAEVRFVKYMYRFILTLKHSKLLACGASIYFLCHINNF